MGNEASLEGGEGALAGLPAGLAPDGKGGFIQMPAGVEADLSNLSEEERKQLVAAMAKAQSRQVEVSINVCRNHDDDVRLFSVPERLCWTRYDVLVLVIRALQVGTSRQQHRCKT